MQALRNSLSLTRLVLAWFMLTLSIAMASPIVHPKAIEVVCTSSGSMQVIMLDEDGQATPGLHHSLDCPLCLTITAPPTYSSPHLEQPQPLGLALQPVVSARIAALVGAPLPPRGPPTLV
ncbi:hypothetical protein GL58_25720 [Comamonas testosteroni]|uniref:DUF2946 domain-containing protein n=1 Tax=Comamonas testosteroni TaxID=285 RepID=A0A0L7MAS4_COMTE|nr:DUF2946 family protein [Comamonas testosteroni]KOC19005.1 hypothetical protein GL58_25720 [Comamonas testosteroni]